MRRVALTFAVLALALAISPAASAGELKTIEVTSPHVEFSEEPPPLGTEGRAGPTLHANVLLPDGYDPDRRRGYPVLYLLHGATSDYRMWKSVGVERIAADFPGVIVMPDGGGFGMYTDWYNRGEFGKPRWMTYHLTDLRRAINRRFNIRSGRRWHAIGGLSMGGMGAMRYAAADPGYFGSAFAISGAALELQKDIVFTVFDGLGLLGAQGTTYDDVWGPRHGYYASAHNPIKLVPNLRHTRLWIGSGDGLPCPDNIVTDVLLEAELRIQATSFAAAAREAGADVTEWRECGGHNSTAGRGLTAALAWGVFDRSVRAKPRSWTYITARPSGRMHDLRFRFAERPATVIRFERAGRKLSATGEGEVTIRVSRRCSLRAEIPFKRRLDSACR